MTGEGKNITEAQMQIEKLKNLKINRETRAQKARREEYSFDKDSFEAEKTAAEKPEEKNTQPETAPAAAHEKHHKPASGKFIRTVRVEKYNFDGLHRMVNEINKKRPGVRLTKDKLVNLLLKHFLEAHPDFGDLGSRESIEEIIKGFKFK
ncbi:MAG TPA: hypothetical protein PLB12_06225 [Candidatus Goldiibacteriota bacterium]|nr:hypothetical protein [Candidatus Goldiibacteriota bacterium]HPN64875.1 hypothetical protein [Candidatus Goldiibacteriota bacterium]HRQ43934.1 hypothetical protein [Candidatus Goldiibacteriota bacterium]